MLFEKGLNALAKKKKESMSTCALRAGNNRSKLFTIFKFSVCKYTFFCLSPLLKHARKEVGGFEKKFVLVLV